MSKIKDFITEVLIYEKSVKSLDMKKDSTAFLALDVMNFQLKKIKMFMDSGDLETASQIADLNMEKIKFAKEATKKWRS